MVGGLHTVAKAAASLGICVQANGDVVLDCSDVTDPTWSTGSGDGSRVDFAAAPALMVGGV